MEALRRLIADPALRMRMAQAGRVRILAHFSAGQMLDRMQALLDQATLLAQTAPRPPVGHGAGLVAAALAIEHYQLDARLRALPLARPILALRQSYAWRLLGRLRGLRATADAAQRSFYVARRTFAQWVRRFTNRDR